MQNSSWVSVHGFVAKRKMFWFETKDMDRNSLSGAAMPQILVAPSAALPYMVAMHTVIEMPAYLSAADDAGMSDGERQAAVDIVSANPEAGDVMVGTSGCRKLRLAGKGKGKSGGYRLITYFQGGDGAVFLLTVFAKGDRANLTKAEMNALSLLVREL